MPGSTAAERLTKLAAGVCRLTGSLCSALAVRCGGLLGNHDERSKHLRELGGPHILPRDGDRTLELSRQQLPGAWRHDHVLARDPKRQRGNACQAAQARAHRISSARRNCWVIEESDQERGCNVPLDCWAVIRAQQCSECHNGTEANGRGGVLLSGEAQD